MYEIKASWKSGYAFEQQANGFTFVTDAKYGDQDTTGPSPKTILLNGLAGCTGIDIVSLLEKMRVEVRSIDIDVSADLTEDHPKIFKDIKIYYRIVGTAGKRDKVVKAIELSMTRYCGVSAMLGASSDITYELDYVEV